MKKLILILLILGFVLINCPKAFAQISIGVEPSEVKINFYGAYTTRMVNFKFFNPNGQADAVYSVVIEDDLKEFVRCDWCDSTFIVPMGSTRFSGFVTKQMIFTRTTGERYVSSKIYVYAKPVGENGTVAVKPRIAVNILINQSALTTMTTTTMPTITTTTGITNPTTIHSTTPGITNPTTIQSIPITTIPTTITTIPTTNPITPTTISTIAKLKESWSPTVLIAVLIIIVIGAVIYFKYFYSVI